MSLGAKTFKPRLQQQGLLFTLLWGQLVGPSLLVTLVSLAGIRLSSSFLLNCRIISLHSSMEARKLNILDQKGKRMRVHGLVKLYRDKETYV